MENDQLSPLEKEILIKIESSIENAGDSYRAHSEIFEQNAQVSASSTGSRFEKLLSSETLPPDIKEAIIEIIDTKEGEEVPDEQIDKVAKMIQDCPEAVQSLTDYMEEELSDKGTGSREGKKNQD